MPPNATDRREDGGKRGKGGKGERERRKGQSKRQIKMKWNLKIFFWGGGEGSSHKSWIFFSYEYWSIICIVSKRLLFLIIRINFQFSIFYPLIFAYLTYQRLTTYNNLTSNIFPSTFNNHPSDNLTASLSTYYLPGYHITFPSALSRYLSIYLPYPRYLFTNHDITCLTACPNPRATLKQITLQNPHPAPRCFDLNT